MIAAKRRRYLGLVFSVIPLLSFLTLFQNVLPAQAAGESGRWVNASNIYLTGGRLAGNNVFTSQTPAKLGQPFPIFNGRVTDSTGCFFLGTLTVTSAAGDRATIAWRAATTTGPQQPCNQSIINQYGTSVTLSDTGNIGKREEDTKDHTAQVQARPVSDITDEKGAESANVPKTDTITLKQGSKTLSSQKAPLTVAGYVAYNASFNNLAPGNYTACSVVAENCKDFTITQEAKTIQVIIEGKNAKYSGTPDSQVCTTGTGLAGALAWVLCPLAQLIADASDLIERNLIVPYLTVSPLTTASDNPVYSLWKAARDFANIAFVIVFFVVVFSQATSIGLSNYGVKRMLPRMAGAAIAANLSYFIVAFIIDAFNVIGAGVATLVMAVVNSGAPAGGGNGGASATQFFVLGGAALAAVIVTGGAALGWMMSLIGLAFLIIIIAVIVLIIRQMVILLLVVVSPLAFVAWLLPNTERYYSKWQGLLIQLLMMYPLIVLLFATGKIFSKLLLGNQITLTAPSDITFSLLNTLTGFAAPGKEDVAEAIKVMMAYIANAVPLILLPATFLASGTIMSRTFGALQRGGLRGARGAKSAYDNSSYGQYRKQQAEQRQQQELLGNQQRGAWYLGGLPRPSQVQARGRRQLYNRLPGGYGAYMNDQLLTGAKENQDKVKDALSSLSPFAAQAVLASRGNQADLRREVQNRLASGQINAADAAAIDRLNRQGLLMNGNGLAGAAASLAKTGFLTQQYVADAEAAINRQYSNDEQGRRIALDRMADSISSGAKESGMAQHMRWGLVGGQLIQNGQDFDANATYEMNNGTRVAPGAPVEQRVQAFREHVVRENENFLGFQKVSADKITRKSFNDNGDAAGAAYARQAFEHTFNGNETFRNDAILTAGGKGTMSAQDREALRNNVQRVLQPELARRAAARGATPPPAAGATEAQQQTWNAELQTSWQELLQEERRRVRGGGSTPTP